MSVISSVCPTIIQIHSENTQASCFMKFPESPIPRKIPFIDTSLYLSVNPSGSLSITPSPSAENPPKFPTNNGEKNVAKLPA